MTIQEATQLPDGTPIQEITFTVHTVGEKKLASPNNPSWGHEYFCQCFDATGKCGVIFKFKKPGRDPNTWKGHTIKCVTSHNQAQELTGIKLKHKGEYRNIYVTDSATITIVGAGSQPVQPPQATGTGLVSQPASYRQQPPPPQAVGMSPEEYAKHCATCWCQVYDWTADIFKSRLGNDALVRECVTSVVITMQRDHIAILPFTDRPYNWKDYEFKGKKLSEYPVEKLMIGYAFVLQGKVKNDEAIKAFTAAFEATSGSHRSVYGQLLLKEEIDEDTGHTTLLRRIQAVEDMTDDDFKAVIADEKFFEEAKALQVAKATPFDDAVSLD